MAHVTHVELPGLLADQPRYRYCQQAGGPMFCWTTEPMDGGVYQSFVYRPVGKGSRSGNASEWRLDQEATSSHRLRKDAKARALRLFREWKAVA